MLVMSMAKRGSNRKGKNNRRKGKNRKGKKTPIRPVGDEVRKLNLKKAEAARKRALKRRFVYALGICLREDLLKYYADPEEVKHHNYTLKDESEIPVMLPDLFKNLYAHLEDWAVKEEKRFGRLMKNLLVEVRKEGVRGQLSVPTQSLGLDDKVKKLDQFPVPPKGFSLPVAVIIYTLLWAADGKPVTKDEFFAASLEHAQQGGTLTDRESVWFIQNSHQFIETPENIEAFIDIYIKTFLKDGFIVKEGNGYRLHKMLQHTEADVREPLIVVENISSALQILKKPRIAKLNNVSEKYFEKEYFQKNKKLVKDMFWRMHTFAQSILDNMGDYQCLGSGALFSGDIKLAADYYDMDFKSFSEFIEDLVESGFLLKKTTDEWGFPDGIAVCTTMARKGDPKKKDENYFTSQELYSFYEEGFEKRVASEKESGKDFTMKHGIVIAGLDEMAILAEEFWGFFSSDNYVAQVIKSPDNLHQNMEVAFTDLSISSQWGYTHRTRLEFKVLPKKYKQPVTPRVFFPPELDCENQKKAVEMFLADRERDFRYVFYFLAEQLEKRKELEMARYVSEGVEEMENAGGIVTVKKAKSILGEDLYKHFEKKEYLVHEKGKVMTQTHAEVLATAERREQKEDVFALIEERIDIKMLQKGRISEVYKKIESELGINKDKIDGIVEEGEKIEEEALKRVEGKEDEEIGEDEKVPDKIKALYVVVALREGESRTLGTAKLFVDWISKYISAYRGTKKKLRGELSKYINTRIKELINEKINVKIINEGIISVAKSENVWKNLSHNARDKLG